MKRLRNKKFFSYATVAPMSRVAYEAARRFMDEFYTYGPPEVLYEYDRLVDEMAVEAARLLRCDASEITYLKNTTEGIMLASEALPLSAGDEVLVLGNEYPANLLPWLRLRQRGIKVTVIKGTDNAAAFARLLAAVGPKTRAIAMSSTQYYDGYMPNLRLLARACRDQNIFLVVDAVQTIGVRVVDLAETPVDMLVCGGQKYLRAGMGIGFMYVNRLTLGRLRDTKAGIRSMEHFDDEVYVLKNSAARFQDGTQNVAGLAALHAAIRDLNETGMANIAQKNLELLGGIKEILRSYDIEFIDHGQQQGNIVSMRVADPAGLFQYLMERGVYIKPIKDVARLSFIHETKLSDVNVLAKLTRAWLDRQ